MRLAGEQLVLDTNVLVHLLRPGAAGQALDGAYALSTRIPRAIVPAVVTGELKAFAYYRGWGGEKLAKLEKLITSLPVADYASPQLVDTYARFDVLSRARGRKMGKNDLWIAGLVVDSLLKGQIDLRTDADRAVGGSVAASSAPPAPTPPPDPSDDDDI